MTLLDKGQLFGFSEVDPSLLIEIARGLYSCDLTSPLLDGSKLNRGSPVKSRRTKYISSTVNTEALSVLKATRLFLGPHSSANFVS